MTTIEIKDGKATTRKLTAEEIAAMEAEQERAEAEYWQTVDYDEAVNAEIRKRYSESQEFALHRQKDKKPIEYAEYDEYCEFCKAYVKEKKMKYKEEKRI